MTGAETGPWVRVGDVCRDRMGMQCQYGSRHLTGVAGRARLGDDLRWHGGDERELWHKLGPGGNYHALLIHQDDVDTWVARVDEHRRATGQIA